MGLSSRIRCGSFILISGSCSFVKNREIFRYFFFQSSAINFKSDVVEAAYVSTAASTKMKPYHLFLKPAK